LLAEDRTKACIKQPFAPQGRLVFSAYPFIKGPTARQRHPATCPFPRGRRFTLGDLPPASFQMRHSRKTSLYVNILCYYIIYIKIYIQ
jgi:hypothetical protein